MSRVWTVAHESWSGPPTSSASDDLAEALERGQVVFLPRLRFDVMAHERNIFSPQILSSSKNASFDPETGRVGGTTLQGDQRSRLQQLMARFSDSARSLVWLLFPRYREHLRRGRTSFRPAVIAGRQTSWRQDDTRLHIDSFPASPVQGRRILRVFTNVNPEGRVRSWRVGGEFEDVATRFAGALSVPWPATTMALHWFRITKQRRSPYDALMLQLHDRMKEDRIFQESCEQEPFDFPSGSTWIAFTDQVSHAAMSGQYQLEQTFLLPVERMLDERRSPLRILERIKARRLTS